MTVVLVQAAFALAVIARSPLFGADSREERETGYLREIDTQPFAERGKQGVNHA